MLNASTLGTLSRRLSCINLSKFAGVNISKNDHVVKGIHSISRQVKGSSYGETSYPMKASTRNICKQVILKSSPLSLSKSNARFQSSKSDDDGSDKNNELSENDEWVKFQQKIQVKGFDTGQQITLSHTNSGQVGKKRRGGKTLRKKLEKQRMEQNAANDNNVQLGGGHFPALRFSEEETARLLQEAFEGIPKRTGKRGTRNLKRQENKARKIRQYNAIRKQEKINAHFRKMAKRSQKVKDIRAVYDDAPALRERDQLYQQKVLERWTQIAMAQEKGVQGEKFNGLESHDDNLKDSTMIEGVVVQK